MIRHVRFLVTFFAALPNAAGAAGATNDDFSMTLVPLDELGTVTVRLAWDASRWTSIQNVQGWAFGVCHDETVASIGDCSGYSLPNTCSWCPALTCPPDMQGLAPPGDEISFHSLQVYPGGVIQGVLLSFQQEWYLRENDTPLDALTIEYSHPTGCAELELSFCDTLGTPPAECAFIVQSTSFCRFERNGVTIYAGSCEEGTLFTRGDSNGDAALDIADASCITSYLFLGADHPCRSKVQRCFDAADANDDGAIDIADAITVLVYLFAQGPLLPAPSARCGPDPTPDDLTCGFYESCS